MCSSHGRRYGSIVNTEDVIILSSRRNVRWEKNRMGDELGVNMGRGMRAGTRDGV